MELPNRTKLVQEPDGSILATCSRLKNQSVPFLIIEVANTQTEAHVLEKVRKYIKGTRGRISIIFMLKIFPKPERTTHLWMWKVSRTVSPVSRELLFEDLQIYPSFNRTDLVFDFSIRDLFPLNEWVDDEPSSRCDLTEFIGEVKRIIDHDKIGNIFENDTTSAAKSPDVSDEESFETDHSSGSEEQESQALDQGSEYSPSKSGESEAESP